MACFITGVVWIWTVLIIHNTVRMLGSASPSAFEVPDSIIGFLSVAIALAMSVVLFREKIRDKKIIRMKPQRLSPSETIHETGSRFVLQSIGESDQISFHSK
jgi:hypothetical protein